MSIGDDRILTRVVSGPTIGPDMQPVFIGHCPGKANLEALFEDSYLQNRLEQQGYSERIAAMRDPVDDEHTDRLDMLPLPIRSLAQFQRLFPAAQLNEQAVSATMNAWLPWAVRDFFAVATDQSDDRLCWVILVDAEDAIEAFDVDASAVQHLPKSWRAVELACSIESAGILVMPDFERLLVPYTDQDISRKRLPNPLPTFHPCSAELDDNHRERRYSTEMPDSSSDEKIVSRILRIAQRLQAWRPDMQWILSLAPEIEHAIAMPKPIAKIDEWLRTTAGNHPELARVQFVFPLVYGDARPLTSASGLLAGHIVHKTRTEGVWRSIAGMPLASVLSPWPEIGRKQRFMLREELGLGVLHQTAESLQLDDERLVVKGFCDHTGTACRSGELMRFIGWLRRSLRDLGEDMIFQLDGRDPVVGNMLDTFFRELHQKGALRGAQTEDAYRLTNLSSTPNLIHYQIEIAPSFPVDRFIVTFMHDREANGPSLSMEAAAHA